MKISPRLRSAALVATLSLGSGACSAQELVVSAAASLTNAFQAVGQAFEKARPGAKVTFNFAASGPVAGPDPAGRAGRRLRVGRPGDHEPRRQRQPARAGDARRLRGQHAGADRARQLAQAPEAARRPRRTRRSSASPPARRPRCRSAATPWTRSRRPASRRRWSRKWIYGESVRQVLELRRARRGRCRLRLPHRRR